MPLGVAEIGTRRLYYQDLVELGYKTGCPSHFGGKMSVYSNLAVGHSVP
jgi:hypothetical protein